MVTWQRPLEKKCCVSAVTSTPQENSLLGWGADGNVRPNGYSADAVFTAAIGRRRGRGTDADRDWLLF